MPVATEHAFRKAITAGTFAPVYYLHGEDEFRKAEAVARAVDVAAASPSRDFNLDVRYGGDLDAETLGSVLDTPPLMADRRVVVVREVGTLRKDARRALNRYLERPAPDTLLLLVAGAGTAPDRSLMERATTVEFPELTGDRLPKWIAHHASELGATVTPGAVSLLVQAVGSGLPALASELDKLASYARGAVAEARGGPPVREPAPLVIDEDAVGAVVGVRRGETLGDLLDRVAQRDAAGALALVDHVLSQPKTTAVSVVMALATQTLALGWGRARLDQGVSPARLPGEYRGLLSETRAFPMRPWSEAVEAWARAAGGWTVRAVDRALEALSAADAALKETRLSTDEQIIASLVLAMCVGDAEERGTRRSAA